MTTLCCVTKHVHEIFKRLVTFTRYLLHICAVCLRSLVTCFSLDSSCGISSLDRQLWHPPTDRQCKLGPSIGNSGQPRLANSCKSLQLFAFEYFHDFTFRQNSVEVELWGNEATFNFGCQPKLDQTQILTFPLIIGACNQTFRNFA